MSQTFAYQTLRGRAVSLLLGTFLLGALFVVLASEGAAQNPATKDKTDKAKDAAPEKKGDMDKGKDAKAPALKLRPPIVRKLAFHPKIDADVPEMTKSINAALAASWKDNNIVHADFIDDHEFIRRASLDIIGRIATREEITTYMKNPAETRRSILIDDLLKSDEYPRHWANLWTNWLLGRTGVFGKGRYHEDTQRWLQKQFALNRHYDQIVNDLITASGKNDENPATNFILAHVGENVPGDRRGTDGQFEMVPITARITRIFLGTQVQCAQCHDHPFRGDLKQQFFWGVNAFLRQVAREGNIPMRRQDGLTTLTLLDDVNVNREASAYYEPRNAALRKRKAVFLPAGDQEDGPEMEKGLQGIERRKALARFVLDYDTFPKAIVNRMWGVFFGRGFTTPVDDFHDQNLPSNPDLLNLLAARFKNYDYDQKKLIRWICNSNAYNLSYVANPTNDKAEQEPLFSRMLMKSMSPEQLFESLMTATGSEAAEKGNEAERAKLKAEWLDKLVAQFGDDEGNEVNFNGTVVQALMMMNGDEINKAISRKDKGTVWKVVSSARGPDDAIRGLFLASLNREPTARELKQLKDKFPLVRGRDKDVQAPYQDLFWALLNSNEFLLNH